MPLVKYKVTGSFLDRTYYSGHIEIDASEFESEEDIEDYLEYLTIELESNIPIDWKHEGSEDSGGGFKIESIEKIS